MSTIIQQLEAEQMHKSVPDFRSGDTIKVEIKVKEGNRERLQAFEGLVIAKSGRSFTVRKISHGEGVERVFPIYSPLIASITRLRRGAVRKSKLYYIRELRGRAARIKEDLRANKTTNSNNNIIADNAAASDATSE